MSEVPPYEEGLRSVISSHHHRRRPLAMDGDDDDPKARAEEDAGGGGGGKGGEGGEEEDAREQTRRRHHPTTRNTETTTATIPIVSGGNGWDGGLRRDTSGLSIASSQGKRSRSDLLAAAEEEEKVCVVETDDAAAAAAKSLRPTSTAEAMRVGATSEDLTQAEFVNGSNSNSLGESPTTRLGYLNQATFDSNKSKGGVSGSGHNNNSSTTNEGKPPKHAGGDCGTQTNMLAENSAVARVALDAHAARAPSPAEGMNSKLLRVRSMVTLEGTVPDLSAMGGDSSAEGSLEVTDDEDTLMTDEEMDVPYIRHNQQDVKEVDSPMTKSKQTSENDGGANLDRSGHSDGSVRSAEDGVTTEATTLVRKQPKATLKPPARVIFGAHEVQGHRPYMEDRYKIIEDWKFECAGKMSENNYYNNNNNNGQQERKISDKQYIGVYDGHNGDWAASYAKEKMHTHLEKCSFIANGIAPDAPQHELEQFELGVKNSLIRSFVDLDEEILDGTKALNRRDGSTASVVLRVSNHLFVAHAGDTRIVVGKRSMGLHDVRVKALTEDHKPSLPRERKRVYDEGGRVEFCGCWRVIAENRDRNVRAALAVSRAIGDIDFKRPENKGVTATPDVDRITLDDEIENVIVATDGLWDVVGDQDAIRLCRSVLKGRFSEDACREAAEALTEEALERGSSDNVTIVVACFQH